MNIHETQRAVQQELAQHHDTMIQFLCDLVAIPSYDSQIGPVGDAVGARMADLGFDEVRRDSMGNILGRIGSGLVFCSTIAILIRSVLPIQVNGNGIPSRVSSRMVLSMALALAMKSALRRR